MKDFRHIYSQKFELPSKPKGTHYSEWLEQELIESQQLNERLVSELKLCFDKAEDRLLTHQTKRVAELLSSTKEKTIVGFENCKDCQADWVCNYEKQCKGITCKPQ